MTRTKKASSKRGGVKLFGPPTAVLTAAKRGRLHGNRVPLQYPKRFDDIKDLFLSKSEFLHLKALLKESVNRGGET